MASSNVNNINTKIDTPTNIKNYNTKSLNNTQEIKSLPNFSFLEEIGQNIQTEIFEFKKETSKYVNTNLSDLDNIYTNKIINMTVSLQNDFNSNNKQFYEIYKEYFKGKKVSDTIDSNGRFKKINYDTKFIDIATKYPYMKPKDIYDKMNEIIENNDLKTILSKDIMNASIEEIVNTESGYDCIVLRTEDGKYMQINSSTNAKSIEDIATIAYSMSKYIFGNTDLLKFLLEDLLKNSNIEQSADSFLKMINSDNNDLTEEFCKSCYENQIKDNEEIMKKYVNKAISTGNRLILNGYSLGGGSQLTAYSKFCEENPNLKKYIQAVTVYNPFTLYCQEYNEKYIDNLKNDNNVLIYSAEEDFVSIFNDSVEKLKDRTVYVQAESSEQNDIENILSIGSLITGGIGNHGFIHINTDSFDKDGNITQEGNFKSLQETLSKIEGTYPKYKQVAIEKEYKPDFNIIMPQLLDLDSLNKYTTPIKNTFKYIRENFGEYNYEELTSHITDDIWNIVDEEIKNKDGALGWLANNFKNEYGFKQGFNKFFNDEEIKNEIIDTIGYKLNNLDENYKYNVEDLLVKLNNMIDTSVIGKNPYFIRDLVNIEITDQICDKIRDTLL